MQSRRRHHRSKWAHCNTPEALAVDLHGVLIGVKVRELVRKRPSAEAMADCRI